MRELTLPKMAQRQLAVNYRPGGGGGGGGGTAPGGGGGGGGGGVWRL
jgi:hypothetical protein